MLKNDLNGFALRAIMAAVFLALVSGCNAVADSAAAAPTPAVPTTPITPAEAPPAPTGLVAIPGNGLAHLSWSASTGAASYDVKRSTISGGPYTPLTTAMSPAYTDTTVSTGATYYYVVAAANSEGVSPPSAQASVTLTVAVTAPSAPTGLAATAGNTQVSLSWSASNGAASYAVKRATTSSGPYTQVGTPTSPSYTDTAVSNGTTYYYVVLAMNSAGPSGNSSPVNATPVAPVLPPVGSCDNLPAPGVWENVTPASTGNAANSVNGTNATGITIDPFNPRRVWLGTSVGNKEFWRSDDCGATWTQVNKGPGSGDSAHPGGVGDGAQWSMQADFVSPGVLYATSGYGAQSLWKTTDGGYSWSDLFAGTEYEKVAQYRFVNNVSMDPADHLHLVVTTHGYCEAPYAPNCIAESLDGGKSWKVFTAPESWVEGGGLVVVKGGLWVWCGTKMLVTKDGGKSWNSNPLAGGGSCEAEYTIRNFVPASNGKYYLGSRAGVLRSSNGEAWEHVQGTDGLMVMVTQGSRKVFASNQWQPVIKWASLDNDTVWHDIPAPPQLAGTAAGGIAFLAYDDARGILYASMFMGGVARMVIP